MFAEMFKMSHGRRQLFRLINSVFLEAAPKYNQYALKLRILKKESFYYFVAHRQTSERPQLSKPLSSFGINTKVTQV